MPSCKLKSNICIAKFHILIKTLFLTHKTMNLHNKVFALGVNVISYCLNKKTIYEAILTCSGLDTAPAFE